MGAAKWLTRLWARLRGQRPRAMWEQRFDGTISGGLVAAPRPTAPADDNSDNYGAFV